MYIEILVYLKTLYHECFLSDRLQCCNNAVRLVTWIRAGRSGFQFPIGERYFSLFQNVQVTSGALPTSSSVGRVKTDCDVTSAETRFGLPAKRTSPFISAGVSVQSSTGFLGVRVKLKTAGYPLHSPISPSLLLPCVAVCHQIPFPLYHGFSLGVKWPGHEVNH